MITKELTDWTLGANYPHAPTATCAAETGQILSSVLEPIPATVPGCVHNDLLRAGLIPDPYYEMNALSCAFVEQFWWTYTTQFTLEERLRGRHIRLTLRGIDYEGQITLNHTSCGTHTGMYVPFSADITDLVRFGEPNELAVILHEPPREMGQLGYTSRTHTQKARFTYKWDFSTRLVQVGLYDRVLIEDFGRAALNYTRVDARLTEDGGELRAESELTVFSAGDVTVRWALTLAGAPVAEETRTVTLEAGTQKVAAVLPVAEPQLWYPNGAGAQPVYTLTVTLSDEAGLSDRAEYSCGFRDRCYLRAEGAPAGCLPYGVAFSGERVYIKGVNMVPLDICYGRITPERTEKFLRLAREAGVNLVRVWGGGLIGSEWFYTLCDRFGLMVWQEFIQSSSGLDNVPSKDPEFLRLCARTATHAVREKQPHPSLTFWCGGNELEDENRVPATFDDENLAMLKAITDRYDGETLMLPTSATGFFEFLDVTKPGQNYDVHGPWKYDGPTAHYTTYNRSDSQLHSEFGVDGMNPLSSLKTVLSAENLKVQSMANPVWRFHGEMWDTFFRDQELFGPLPETALEEFILSSQAVQAEGLRYALEANRRRAYQNVGSIIWQLNEPWPNVSGTNLVDYYGTPKLAYYAVAQAFRPAYPNLAYDKWLFEPGEAAALRLFMTAEGEAADWVLTVSAVAADGTALPAPEPVTVTVGGGRSVCAAKWVLTMPPSGAVTLELTAHSGGTEVKNRYILFVKNADGFADRSLLLFFFSKKEKQAKEKP